MQVTGKHLCWSYFLIKLQACRFATLLKRDSNTGVFLWILWRTSANSCFCTSNHYVCNKYWASLLNQKHEMGSFLLRFVDLVRVYSLLIISRNHFNTFLLLQMQWNYFMSILICAKKQVAKFLTIPFLKNTSQQLLFLKYFFVSLDKSVLLHYRSLM